ncbi:DUF1963 domain-containing protein [Coleofasciculus sp. FACHB-1120]|uniref:DUF1963 domain-containing protein n=1 Tax=Coleofasciculus sp. FACHB-1120 TaxID=2692783 RepID=UPI001685D737|nr:DUF1963 domain-containing protein [Coleofasciculus sp. FACHB-1120]MBD2741223.1 DUF1963 domain-containing protein [Coleofasciculus sp. FACHB-1120]
MQSDDLKLAQLKQKLNGVRRSAWKPIVQEGDGDLTASKFAGKPWLSADETWPTCPNCQKPMQFFLQLNLDKLPESLNGKFGSGLLQFFYCTNYEPPYCHCEVDCGAWEAFVNTQLVRIIQPNTAPLHVEIPGIEDLFDSRLILNWEEIYDYPDWQELEIYGINLNKEEDDVFFQNKLYQLGDKLAGWPIWVQGLEYPNCPHCNQAMNQFVFQLESDGNVPHMWGDAGIGYLIQCPEHKEQLAFLWQC